MITPVLSGRHFLQIPGPSNIPERVLRAMDRGLIDHRGSQIHGLVDELVTGLRRVFGTESGTIVLWAGSGNGAWEASLVNTLAPGDRALAFGNGLFSSRYGDIARKFGVEVDTVDLRWGEAVTPEVIARSLRAQHTAVLLVHNETSTGVTADVGAIRTAIDATGHDPLLLVDGASAVGSLPTRFDDWRADVVLTGSQKGLMTPPGLAICCVSERALERSRTVSTARHFYDWRPFVEAVKGTGFWPATPPTQLFFGLREALRMLEEEGLDEVYNRHFRLAEGVRRAVAAWDLATVCVDPERSSHTITAVNTDGVSSDEVLRLSEERLNLALGMGLGPYRGRGLRIGHLGSLNELEVLATVGGTELALSMAGHPVELGTGVTAAVRWFRERW
ncbi:MAG: aminotransferase class V-fold PLP-dependent enzyme [Chloroflexota bacterium]